MIIISNAFITPVFQIEGDKKPPIESDSLSYVRNLSGVEFPIQTTITHVAELNGNQSVSFNVLPTKVNKPFIDDITEMWEFIDTSEVVHKIIYCRKQGQGNILNVAIKAIPLFYDAMDNERIYEEYNQHMTALNAFTLIFEGMPFGFVIVDESDAVEWEGFGAGESRLETFKRAINRYNYEFRISGNTVYLEAQIGRDTSFMYRYKLNASNIVKEIDANEYWTYAKGYGDYGEGSSTDWQEANLTRDYTSPMAEILGIRHAPPIKDGRITVSQSMDDALKTLVDESLKISVTTDIHDLRRQGYALAQPELGDRVFIIDERIGLDEEVRVIDMNVTKDWRGNILDLKLTIGSKSLTKRHQSNISTAVGAITDLIAGRGKLPFSVLDDAVKNATKALKDTQTELSFSTNGILAVDKNDPNLLTLFNSAGVGVSNDGGNTFKNSITGNGVVAEAIIGQSIIGVNLSSANEQGYFHVNGSDAEFYDVTSNRRVTISPSGLYGYNSGGDVRFRADSILVTSSALGTSNYNVYLAAKSGKEARVVDIKDVPSDGEIEDYTYLPVRADGYYGNYLENSRGSFGPNIYIRPRSGGEVRITAAGTTDIYYDVRANNYFGRGIVTLTTNGYYGVDGEFRVTNKGYVTGSVSTMVYRDVRASGYYGQFIAAEAGYNLYMGTDSEVRITSRGMGSNNPVIYRPIKASSFLKPDGSNAIVGMRSFISMRPLDDEATGIIENLNVVRYTDEDYPEFRILSESSPAVATEDGNATDISKTLMYSVKAIQELNERIKTLEGDS